MSVKENINSLSEEDILINAIRFALNNCPRDEKGVLVEFQKYKAIFSKCVRWLKDNYEPFNTGSLSVEEINKLPEDEQRGVFVGSIS